MGLCCFVSRCGSSANRPRCFKDLNEFKALLDVIVSNRMDEPLADVEHKVYTSDLYNRD